MGWSHVDEMIDDLRLEEFELVRSDDAVKTDLELICLRCAALICDVQADDTLGVLVRTAVSHICAPWTENSDG